MKIRNRYLVLAAADLPAESAFWAGVLGGTVDDHGDSHMVVVAGRPQVGIALDPDHVPDTSGDSSHRTRLDLWVEDPIESDGEVMALGARVVQHGEPDETSRNTYRMYESPAGHPFCLCWVAPLPSDT